MVIVVVGAIIALLITAGALGFALFVVSRGGSHGANAQSSPNVSAEMLTPVTGDSHLIANGGKEVFSDDFRDPGSGWFTGTAASGSTYKYSDGAYQIVGVGSLHHLAYAPYAQPFQQLSIAVTATQTDGAPDGAGFGVVCDTGDGSSELHYTLLVEVPGDWFLERTDGPSSATNAAEVLKQGSTSAAPGGTALTVTGMCATLPDGHTTRIALFVNGDLIADTSDNSGQTPALSGWVGGIATSSRSSEQSTVTFTDYVQRDLTVGS